MPKCECVTMTVRCYVGPTCFGCGGHVGRVEPDDNGQYRFTAEEYARYCELVRQRREIERELEALEEKARIAEPDEDPDIFEARELSSKGSQTA